MASSSNNSPNPDDNSLFEALSGVSDKLSSKFNNKVKDRTNNPGRTGENEEDTDEDDDAIDKATETMEKVVQWADKVKLPHRERLHRILSVLHGLDAFVDFWQVHGLKVIYITFFTTFVAFFVISFFATPSSLSSILELYRRKFEVDGMSVAVVHKGQVIMSKGFGVASTDVLMNKDFGVTKVIKNLTNAKTVFGLGENSKIFTVLAISKAVEEEILDWKTPISKSANVSFYESILTNHANLVDVLSQRTGLPNYDFLWKSYNSTSEVFSKLSELPSLTDFRTEYVSGNLLYILAAEILANNLVNGTFNTYLQSKILDPLNLTSTFVTPSDLQSSDALIADPDFESRTVSDLESPALGVSTSSTDSATLLKFLLAKASGILSPESFSQVVAPQVRIDGEDALMAMGFRVTKYQSRKLLVAKTNDDTGFGSIFCLFPDDNFAVSVFANKNSNVTVAACKFLADRVLFKSKETDWAKVYLTAEHQHELEYKEESKKLLGSRAKDTTPKFPLDQYLGTYSHPAFGPLVISKSRADLVKQSNANTDHESTLQVNLGSVSKTVSHFDYEKFGESGRPIDFMIEFFGDNKVEKVVVKGSKGIEPRIKEGFEFVKLH